MHASERSTNADQRANGFLECLSRQSHLAPREASVRAYLEWMVERNEAGDWEQAELVADYKRLCRGTDVEAMPPKWFGKALEAHGCRRWVGDAIKRGERVRPMMVRIPNVLPRVAKLEEVPWPPLPNGNNQAVNRETAVKSNRAGTHAVA